MPLDGNKSEKRASITEVQHVDNNNTGELTVLKVYELAADAGKECQQLIERFGEESASTVTLKIISILEHLELLVNEKTELEKRVGGLAEELNVCRRELERKTGEYNHLQIDVHGLEDQHLEDLEEWKELLSKARKENKDLKKKLNEKEGQVIQEKVQEQETLKVLLKLKETVDKQRDELRARDSELRTKNQDVEALQQQVDRLARVNGNLRRKQEAMEIHSRHLIREKSHLQVDVMALNKDLVSQQSVSRQSCSRVTVNRRNRGTRTGVVSGSPLSEAMEEEALGKEETDGGQVMEGEIGEEEAEVVIEEGKALIDLKDPNRPRFTLEELRKVLIERDEMHLKVVALEEELEAYRTEEDQTDSPGRVSGSSPNDEGKNKTSGIRKFFANLFKGNKDKTNVEDELKKWEFLDFEEKDYVSTESDVDRPMNTASESTTTKETSESTLKRRHSAGMPVSWSSDGMLSSPSAGSKKTEGWFANLRKSSSTRKEMVEISPSPQRSATAGSPVSPLTRIRSTSLQEIPPPRSTPPPLRVSASDGEGDDDDDNGVANAKDEPSKI